MLVSRLDRSSGCLAGGCASEELFARQLCKGAVPRSNSSDSCRAEDSSTEGSFRQLPCKEQCLWEIVPTAALPKAVPQRYRSDACFAQVRCLVVVVATTAMRACDASEDGLLCKSGVPRSGRVDDCMRECRASEGSFRRLSCKERSASKESLGHLQLSWCWCLDGVVQAAALREGCASEKLFGQQLCKGAVPRSNSSGNCHARCRSA